MSLPLNAGPVTTGQVEMYNEEMKDEILVTRRATYKAEEAVSGLEKDKGRQDLFIDRLMEQARTKKGGGGHHRTPSGVHDAVLFFQALPTIIVVARSAATFLKQNPAARSAAARSAERSAEHV